MIFTSPSWVPALAIEPPDSIPIADFMLNERYGRHPIDASRRPFTCALTRASYTTSEVKERVDYLARGLASEMQWSPNSGTEWEKVGATYSLNSIDALTVGWAIHSLGGIVATANSAYGADELAQQLVSCSARCIFTCSSLLPTVLKAANMVGISESHIFLLEIPELGGETSSKAMKTVDILIRDGKLQSKVEAVNWTKGQGARQVAYLCYSSGTSGLPKGVMISHQNVIANVLQLETFERPYKSRKSLDICLGFLPQSHIYALVVICHASFYRGYEVIIAPKYNFQLMLSSIERFHITTLFVVPPILLSFLNNVKECKEYDLSSAINVSTGAAPLGWENVQRLHELFPAWVLSQGYGLMESATVVSSTPKHDIWHGSSGSLLPYVQCRIVNPEGKEIEGYDEPGELLVKSPSVVLGYLNDAKSTRETFQEGWLRTGDEAMFKVSPSGHEHLFIVDRFKELIKVRPQAHIMTHPGVVDVAVIPILDQMSGELPKAVIVKSAQGANTDSKELAKDIQRYVEMHKSRHKWIRGGVEFVEEIPKSASGKILRRILRDREKQKRSHNGAKL